MTVDGTFQPPEQQLATGASRLEGPGTLTLTDEGLVVSARAFGMVSPGIFRLQAGVGFFLLVVGVWFCGGAMPWLGSLGSGLMLAWFAVTIYGDRRGWVTTVTVPWNYVDEVGTKDDVIAVFSGRRLLIGTLVPSPFFFRPTGDMDRLLAALEARVRGDGADDERSFLDV